jgi:2,4-dienoyl-CoA reductase-like NADH-dependent reductase (Old Yellow Enzyme family)
MRCPITSENDLKDLFSPLELKNRRTLANRLAVAPMTTSQSNPDGTVSEADMVWFERLASDGYGMVISCAAAISRTSIAFRNQLSLESDSMLPGLARLAGRMKGHGCVTVIQLCHGGARTIPELTGTPACSASSYGDRKRPGHVPPRELSRQHIDEVVEDFADASARAARAGFDGVEIHGANGYLITQFISPTTNQRKDDFGGSLANRARLAREVVRACRRKVPEGFIIGCRLSFEDGGLRTKLDIDENIQVMNWLAEDGIDYAHISAWELLERSSKYPEEVALHHIRRGIDPRLPLIYAGGVGSASDATKAMEEGADIVAIGRAAIGNARVPERMARGEELLRPPYPEEALAKVGVSRAFIAYLKKGHTDIVR